MRSFSQFLALISAIALAGCVTDVSGRVGVDPIVTQYFSRMDQVKPKADPGNASGRRLLGDMYFWAEGVEHDEEQAVKYWRLAAEAGDTDAQARLAAYEAGEPVPLTRTGGALRDLFNWADTPAGE